MPDDKDQLRREGHFDSAEKPSSARVYDYFLGGEHNYAIDREFANRVAENAPDIPRAARCNRAFTGRVVRFALRRGITQFIDVGSGLPSQGQAHEIADAEFPAAKARVVYIDYEPIAHAHAEILLSREADPERHRAVIADFNDPWELWRQALETGVIDPDLPICFLTTLLLHFQPDSARPQDSMDYYRRVLPAGSVLGLTHGATATTEAIREGMKDYQRATDQMHFRSEQEIRKFFGDWELQEPGLVWVPLWRPDGGERPWWGDDPSRAGTLGGVAVKPTA